MANKRLGKLTSLLILLSLSTLLTFWTVSSFIFLFSMVHISEASAQVELDRRDERERGRLEAKIENLESELKGIKELKVDMSIALLTRDFQLLKSDISDLKEAAKTSKESAKDNYKVLLTTLAGVLLLAVRAIYMLVTHLIRHGRSYLARNQTEKEEPT
jgi:hypothetical protein